MNTSQRKENLVRAVVIAKGETRHGRKTPMLFAMRNVHSAAKLKRVERIGLNPISAAAAVLQRDADKMFR